MKYKIYKIYSINSPNEIYVGVTKQKLNERLDQHKNDCKNKYTSCSVKKLFNKYPLNTFIIKLLELKECDNKKELNLAEGNWIDKLNAINKHNPKNHKIIDYTNGKIYKIYSPSHPNQIYIGSTVQKLNKRFYCHKYRLDYSSKIIISKYDDCIIELIENYPCDDRNKLRNREKYYINKFIDICVNKHIPNQTLEEYKTKNKDKLKIKRKMYRDKNKEKFKTYKIKYKNTLNGKNKIKLYSKKYYKYNKEKIKIYGNSIKKCECGINIRINYYSNHLKSKKHKINMIYKNFINYDLQQKLLSEFIHKTHIICFCGSKYNRNKKNRHLNSKKHKISMIYKDFINYKTKKKLLSQLRNTVKFVCECNSKILRKRYYNHIQTKKHINNIRKS